MKKFLTAAILAAPLVTDTAIAQDNKLDLAELKCRELFVMQREQIKIVMAWLQAYYLEEDAPPIVDLEKLAGLAQQICPQLVACETYADLELGLQAATQNVKGAGDQPTPGALVVLAGSLYLLGDFFKRFQSDLGAEIGRAHV